MCVSLLLFFTSFYFPPYHDSRCGDVDVAITHPMLMKGTIHNGSGSGSGNDNDNGNGSGNGNSSASDTQAKSNEATVSSLTCCADLLLRILRQLCLPPTALLTQHLAMPTSGTYIPYNISLIVL